MSFCRPNLECASCVSFLLVCPFSFVCLFFVFVCCCVRVFPLLAVAVSLASASACCVWRRRRRRARAGKEAKAPPSHFGAPQIVTASALSDNKIDIHVSVTINAHPASLTAAAPPASPSSSSSAPPPPPAPSASVLALPASLNPVPSTLSGVACTLADLKKHRAQTRHLLPSTVGGGGVGGVGSASSPPSPPVPPRRHLGSPAAANSAASASSSSSVGRHSFLFSGAETRSGGAAGGDSNGHGLAAPAPAAPAAPAPAAPTTPILAKDPSAKIKGTSFSTILCYFFLVCPTSSFIPSITVCARYFMTFLLHYIIFILPVVHVAFFIFEQVQLLVTSNCCATHENVREVYSTDFVVITCLLARTRLHGSKLS